MCAPPIGQALFEWQESRPRQKPEGAKESARLVYHSCEAVCEAYATAFAVQKDSRDPRITVAVGCVCSHTSAEHSCEPEL